MKAAVSSFSRSSVRHSLPFQYSHCSWAGAGSASPQRVKAEFPAYRRAVLMLQARLRRRLDWEERHLHPRLSAFSRAA